MTEVKTDIDANDGISAEARAQMEHAAPELLAAAKMLDDFWTKSHPDGPDGNPKYAGGLGVLTDDTLNVWRTIRRAIAKATLPVS